MDQLLRSLTDSATIVRWSAAKGIGRLIERIVKVQIPILFGRLQFLRGVLPFGFEVEPFLGVLSQFSHGHLETRAFVFESVNGGLVVDVVPDAVGQAGILGSDIVGARTERAAGAAGTDRPSQAVGAEGGGGVLATQGRTRRRLLLL